MKFLIIDDEHELYKHMFLDILNNKNNEYDVKEIKRMIIPKALVPFYKFHFNARINRHLFLPFKDIWNPFYQIHKYKFNPKQKYCIIFLNGSIKQHFSKKYLQNLKRKNPNIKLVMIMYDSYSNPAAKRPIKLIPVFDKVFSFDKEDCEKNGLEYIYSTFSIPDSMILDSKYHSSAFFVGYGQGRLKTLQNTFKKISSQIDDCKFIISGVKEEEKEEIKGVEYNKLISYQEELKYAYNTDCIVEIIKKGQTGITLRTCEAIAFNKKLLTNNTCLKEMPFYDERYMQVFDDANEIDLSFLQENIKVKYTKNDYFSPINILKRLKEIFDN